MITRKLGKLLRGNATPAQMILACLLGAALGFMPGFAQSPGLIVVLALALIVLNANLALAAMVGVVAKVVSLLLLPLSFMVGRFLLDGPTEAVFKGLINAPVLALFGFEYYATSGGLLVGIVFGLILGTVVVKVIQGFRTKVAGLEEGSERYQRWMAKGWVRFLVFVFVGRGPKESYATMIQKKGKIVRPVGVVFAVLVVVLLVAVQMLFSGPLVTSALRNGLERANGATVDLENAEVDLAAGRMTVTNLAMADPNALDTDLLKAAKIEADVSATSLLRKRVKLDRVVLSDAAHGSPRETPGRLVGKAPKPREVEPPRTGEKTLDDYLKDSRKYKDRLGQIRHWLEELSGPSEKARTVDEDQARESLRERLEREVREKGYARVAATHLIEGAPKLTIGELLAEKVRTTGLEGETIDIQARNISTHPYLLNEAPNVAMKSSGETLQVGLDLGAVSAGGGQNSVDFAYRGLPVDRFAENLQVSGGKPMAGGTIDVALQGTIQTEGGTYIDLPLQVTLHNTTVSVSGAGSAPVEKMTIPLGLRGPIDRPRILLDDKQLADALVAAGAGVLAGQLKERTGDLIEEAAPDLKEKVGEQLGDEIGDTAKSLTEGLFGGKKKKKDNP